MRSPIRRLIENKLTYKPNKLNHGALLNRPHERFKFGSQFGLCLDGAWIEHGSNKAALFLHGNKHNLTRFKAHYDLFDHLKISYLTFDYPGYGDSLGTPSEESLYSAARAAYNYLTTTKGFDPQNVIVYGVSLGAAVAAELLQHNQAHCFISEAAFSSARDMGREIVPIIPVWRLFPNRFDNVSRFKGLTLPVHIIHGDLDPVTPITHATRLFESCSVGCEIRKECTLDIITGAAHNDCLEIGGDALKAKIVTWIG